MKDDVEIGHLIKYDAFKSGLSISFEVDIPIGKVGSGLLFER